MSACRPRIRVDEMSTTGSEEAVDFSLHLLTFFQLSVATKSEANRKMSIPLLPTAFSAMHRVHSLKRAHVMLEKVGTLYSELAVRFSTTAEFLESTGTGDSRVDRIIHLTAHTLKEASTLHPTVNKLIESALFMIEQILTGNTDTDALLQMSVCTWSDAHVSRDEHTRLKPPAQMESVKHVSRDVYTRLKPPAQMESVKL